MAADSAKGHAALLIALGGKPKGMPSEDDSDKPEADDNESTGGDDMLDAIRSKDGQALLDVVKRIVHECLAEGDEEDDKHEDY